PWTLDTYDWKEISYVFLTSAFVPTRDTVRPEESTAPVPPPGTAEAMGGDLGTENSTLIVVYRSAHAYGPHFPGGRNGLRWPYLCHRRIQPSPSQHRRGVQCRHQHLD